MWPTGFEAVQDAKREGGSLLTGGKRPPGLDKGFYVQPTVFTGMKPHMRLWREEVFGPVLAAMTFKTEEEAVQLANASEFGLAGAVISADEEVGGSKLVAGTSDLHMMLVST